MAQGKFNGQRAYELLLRQVEFGPRTPGSVGLEKTRQLIRKQLSENGFSTGTQTFEAYAPLLGENVVGKNLYGVYPAGAKVKYLYSAHYDTRPIADMESDPARKQTPIAGANDGASGVAVLLELARIIRSSNTTAGVALVFFDVEDLGLPTESEGFCLGSAYMANNLPPELQFQYGINIDMVGDADLKLPMEMYSWSQANALTMRVWKVGAELHPKVFLKQKGKAVFDDHMPFLTKGREYINIIDFDYPYWHTTSDTADKCSPHSLQSVGDVLFRMLSQ